MSAYSNMQKKDPNMRKTCFQLCYSGYRQPYRELCNYSNASVILTLVVWICKWSSQFWINNNAVFLWVIQSMVQTSWRTPKKNVYAEVQNMGKAGRGCQSQFMMLMMTTMMTYCWLQYVHYKENFLYVTNNTFSLPWDFQVNQMTKGLLYFKHATTEQEQVSCHYIVKI